MSAVRDVCPDMAGTEELRQVEQELRSRIENRKLRQYNIHFKGGNWRILETAKPYKLVLDFDLENGWVRNLFQGLDGETGTEEIQN